MSTVISKREQNFFAMCDKLQKFVTMHDRYPSQNKQSEASLYGWMKRQQTAYKEGTLNDTQVNRLGNIKDWVWNFKRGETPKIKPNINDQKWMNKYNELLKFVAEHHKIPSVRSANEDEHFLGVWCQIQRKEYNGAMRGDRIELLNQIEEWYWSKLDKDIAYYKEIKQFIIDNKKFPDKFSKNPYEQKMANWMKYKLDKIEDAEWQERTYIQEIMALGYSENKEPKCSKREMNITIHRCKQFEKFYEQHKRFPRVWGTFKGERSLGRWYYKQRVDFKKGKMKKDKIEIIKNTKYWKWEEIEKGFDWVMKLWNDTLAKYDEFCLKYKKTPDKYSMLKEERCLANWLIRQQKRFKAGTLNRECVIKLGNRLNQRSFGKKWDEIWEDIYVKVENFILIHDKYPNSDSDNEFERKLGAWVQMQRYRHRLGKLSSKRVEKLKELKDWKFNCFEPEMSFSEK